MARLLLVILALCWTLPALADTDVPRCWQSEQSSKIRDGLFRIFIPTANTNALAVAEVLGVLAQGLAAQRAVGTSFTLDRIEIDVYGDLSHWRETAAFPTLDSFKAAILASLAPVLAVPGVSITCAVDSAHFPVP